MSLRVCAPDFGANKSAAAAPTAAPVTKNPTTSVFEKPHNFTSRTFQNQHSTGSNICENLTHHEEVGCARVSFGRRCCIWPPEQPNGRLKELSIRREMRGDRPSDARRLRIASRRQ